MADPADPSQRTAVFRRSATRGIAGVLALGLVAVLEIARRHAESTLPRQDATPASAPPTAATVPVAPTLSPTPTVRPRVALPLVRPVETAVPTGLEIDFQHGFKSGTLTVFVDDEPVLEQPLSSRVTGKVLTIERRRGRVKGVLEVRPGEHRIRVLVRWNDDARSRTLTATFREGETRRLLARIKGLTKTLVLQWR
jgi:hypothetical protein